MASASRSSILTSRIVANASDPHVVWAAAPAKVTWVALGLGWRHDAATCPSCGALLDWSADRFDCHQCGFAQPDAPHSLDGTAVILDGHRIELTLQLPGAWNRANAALALVAATTHFGVDPTEAAGAMAEVATVAGRFMRVPVGNGRTATVHPRQEPGRMERSAASRRRPRRRVGHDRGQRADRRRQGPVVALGRAVRVVARAPRGGRR